MRTFKSVALVVAMLSIGSAAYAKEAPKADNTAQNKGATQEEAVTADKQSNKKNDVESLAAVRKAVMDSDLSMDAKNCKILFSKGVVTLRGAVDSEEEKAKVESIAKGCSCVTSVKNLLTIAKKPH